MCTGVFYIEKQSNSKIRITGVVVLFVFCMVVCLDALRSKFLIVKSFARRQHKTILPKMLIVIWFGIEFLEGAGV